MVFAENSIELKELHISVKEKVCSLVQKDLTLIASKIFSEESVQKICYLKNSFSLLLQTVSVLWFL